MARIKLSIDDQEALEALFDAQGWAALLHVVDALVKEQEQSLVTMPIDRGPEALLVARAKLAGADALRSGLRDLKELLRKQEQQQRGN